MQKQPRRDFARWIVQGMLIRIENKARTIKEIAMIHRTISSLYLKTGFFPLTYNMESNMFVLEWVNNKKLIFEKL